MKYLLALILLASPVYAQSGSVFDGILQQNQRDAAIRSKGLIPSQPSYGVNETLQREAYMDSLIEGQMLQNQKDRIEINNSFGGYPQKPVPELNCHTVFINGIQSTSCR